MQAGGCGSLLRNTVWAKLGLLCLAGWMINAAQAQPANDNFTNAQSISGTLGSVSGSNVGATVELNEPIFIIPDDNPYGVNIGATIWYVWRAPASGNVTFNTSGSSFDTVLAVYSGNSVGSLTMVGANDDITSGAGSIQSQLSFFATAGATYCIQVSGFNNIPSDPTKAATGTVVLTWTMQTPGFGAGQFRFTSTDYVVSQNESTSPLGPKPPMSATAGARVTVTRVGGAVGRVQVGYTVTDIPLQSLDVEGVWGQNALVTNYQSDGATVLSYTNITATNYETYVTQPNPYTGTGLPATTLEQCIVGFISDFVITATNSLTQITSRFLEWVLRPMRFPLVTITILITPTRIWWSTPMAPSP